MSIVNLTESAKAQMSAMIEEHQKPAVRLSLQGGGCAGFKYNWTMADEINVIVVDYNRKFLVLQYVDPVTGKRKTKSAKTANRKQAEKLAIEWQTELRHGLYKEPSKLTWSEFIERYDSEYMQTEMRKSSQERVHSTFSVIRDLMSPQRLQQITSQWVTQFRLKASDGRESDTVNLHLRNLKAALNWAKSQKMVAEVPEIKQSKKTKSSKQMKGRPITAEEFDRIIDKVPDLTSIGKEWAPAWQLFLKGLWWSGLRLSEAVNLTWDEWVNGIRVSVSGGYVLLVIACEDEKGGKERVYPVAPEFAEMLLAIPEEQRTGFVFELPQTGGKRASSVSSISRKISEVGQLANVKVNQTEKSGETVTKFASSHDLRRAFGVRWSRRIFPAELMELMRHEDIGTTMKYYVGQQAELTAKKLYEALDREQRHNTSHNTKRKAASDTESETAET